MSATPNQHKIVMQALALKQKFADSTDADTAIVTQFAFEAGPIIQWVDRLAAEGIKMPVHIGIAGPAKLQTLLKFAISCGVGPSLMDARFDRGDRLLDPVGLRMQLCHRIG